LALASDTSNAKPYAIRGHFSHRKRSAIRRKRRFSGLFAVSGYRRGGLRAKIPQRSKALSKKIAVFDHFQSEAGRLLGRQKNHAIASPDGIPAALLVLSSATALAAPALTLSDLNLRAGSGTNSPVG